MNKQIFFDIIRQIINAYAFEPRSGFVANCLTYELSGFSLSIEGRNRGTGYIIVRLNGRIVASNCPMSACFEPACLEILSTVTT